MVIADRSADGTRYRLFETLRQFAADRVAETGDMNGLRARHLGHCIAVAEEANRQWVSPRELIADGIFEREWNDLRAAHLCAIATTDLEAADRIVRRPATTLRHVVCTSTANGPSERSSSARWANRPPGATAGRPTLPSKAGDNDAGIDFAERGIRAAPWPDHPDTAWRWLTLIIAHNSAGREHAAADAAQHLATIERPRSDPFLLGSRCRD
jgi:hypothetical protein